MNIRKCLGVVACLWASSAAPSTALLAQTPTFDAFIDDPNQLQFDIFIDSPEWKFFRTKAYCYASEDNERGTLLVGYDRRANRGHLAFWNKSITAYQSADSTYLNIALVNVVPGVGISDPDMRWGSKKFVIAINRSNQRVFNTKLDGLQMLQSFAAFDRVAFVNNIPDVVQNFSLAHSARAMARLRSCQPG